MRWCPGALDKGKPSGVDEEGAAARIVAIVEEIESSGEEKLYPPA